jgi:hypothetical protein
MDRRLRWRRIRFAYLEKEILSKNKEKNCTGRHLAPSQAKEVRKTLLTWPIWRSYSKLLGNPRHFNYTKIYTLNF